MNWFFYGSIKADIEEFMLHVKFQDIIFSYKHPWELDWIHLLSYLFILSPESTWSRDLFIFESIEAQILWKKAKIMALLKQSYLWIHVYFFSKFSGIYLFSHSKHMPIANALDKKSSFLKLSLQIQEILQFFSMKMIDLMLHFWICLLKSD